MRTNSGKQTIAYRIYSNKRRGAYLIFRATSAALYSRAALIRGQRLFKNCTRQIYSRAEAQKHDSNAVGVYLVTTDAVGGKENSCWSCSDRTVTAGNKCASNRKTKERSWGCCPGKVHGPNIRASHHPSREIQSL